MIAGKRKISSGIEFNKYFHQAFGGTSIISNQADVEATLIGIKDIIYSTLHQTEKISKVLKGKSLSETCENIWNFYYKHVQYKEDERFIEQLREPSRLWKDREGDCDCYSISISSILLNLGIPHILRIAKYPKSWPKVPTWQHIYVIVPIDGDITKNYHPVKDRSKYYVIDCVTDYYNYEVKPLEIKDYPMQLARLNGFGEVNKPAEIVNTRILKNGKVLGTDQYNNAYLLTNKETNEWLLLEPVEGLNGFSLKKIVKSVLAPHTIITSQIKPEVKQQITSVAKKVLMPHTIITQAIKNNPHTIAAKLLHKIDKYTNPGSILLRNGILAAMKVNLFNVAGRLKYGYLTPEQAAAKDLDMNTYSAIVEELKKKEKSFTDLGGEAHNFRNAVLKGKGNKGKVVPLDGDDGSEELYEGDPLADLTPEVRQEVEKAFSEGHNPFDLEPGKEIPANTPDWVVKLGERLYTDPTAYNPDALKGLGEPASTGTAAAIAAALATIAAWASTLKGKGNISKNAQENAEFNSENPDGEDQTKSFNTELLTLGQNLVPIAASQLTALRKDVNTGKVDVNALVTTASGIPIATISTEKETPKWVMPAAIIGGGLAIGGIIYAISKSKKKDKKDNLNGLESKPKKARKRKSKKAKKLKVVNL